MNGGGGNEQIKRVPEELATYETDIAKGEIAETFKTRLREFMGSNEEERSLAYIKFINGGTLVGYSIGETAASFPYGDLHERLTAIIRPYLSKDFLKSTVKQKENLPNDPESLPTDLKFLAGREVLRSITTFPFLEIKDKTGIAVRKIEYFNPGMQAESPSKICEYWVARRIHFLDTPTSGNPDTRVSTYFSHPSRVRVGSLRG